MDTILTFPVQCPGSQLLLRFLSCHLPLPPPSLPRHLILPTTFYLVYFHASMSWLLLFLQPRTPFFICF